MKEGVFLDKNNAPGIGEILTHAEKQSRLWAVISEFAASRYRMKEELKFYGKETGWVIRYSKSGKPLFTLIPNPEGFSILIVIGPSLNEKVENISIGVKIRSIFENAKQYHDGRWLLIKIESYEDTEDLKKLIVLKAGSPSRKKNIKCS